MRFACRDCARLSDKRRCPQCQAAYRREHPGRKTQPQDKLRRLVLTRDDYTCALCQRRLPASELECDHYPIPYAQDGPDHPANARTLCRECHRGLPIRRTFYDGPLVA